MAIENKDIGELVKKCKILLLDIEGTTTSISFVKDKLFPYAEENVKRFLDDGWETEDVKDAVSALRKLAIEDKEGSVEGLVLIPGEDATKEEQIEGLVNNVKWQMSCDRKSGALKQVQGLIWKQGYDAGDIKGHVYDDVSPALEQWRSVSDQKVYIYSSGSVQAQKLLFGQSLAGDLLQLIEGHFDTAVGPKQEADSYKKIVEQIGCKADEILFLTDIVKEGEAARSAGLHVALVSREGNTPLPDEATKSFPVLHSLAELIVSNKRKPEPQEPQEEVPAKILKTDAEDGVKSVTTQAETLEKTPEVQTLNEPEKMEVEDMAVTETKQETKEVKVAESIVVQEVTDSKDAANIPEVDAEPVVEMDTADEKIEETKTEAKETEKVADPASTEPKEETKNGDVSAPIVEESPEVVTEIEDITDKEVGDVNEIIEDLEPVVEEPTIGEDMDVLQNVGKVLEKECDEILSKVSNVTNLDNIPMKPLLNPIAEETMDTENTSDIVDRILDSELDLEMKQCTDIDLNSVSEITDAKPEVTEDDAVKDATSEANDGVGEAMKCNVGEANGVKEVQESASTDTKVEEKKLVEEERMASETKDIVTVTEADKPAQDEKVTETIAETITVNPIETPTVEITTALDESVPTGEPKENNETKLETSEIKPEKPDTSETKSEAIETKTEASGNKAENSETKPEENIAQPGSNETKPENSQPQVNGKATNGDAEVVNGDASKDEELNSRLSVKNGDEVNGANGDSKEVELGQGDCKTEEVPDIKVKTVPTEEPRTDPVEQPTEA